MAKLLIRSVHSRDAQLCGNGAVILRMACPPSPSPSNQGTPENPFLEQKSDPSYPETSTGPHLSDIETGTSYPGAGTGTYPGAGTGTYPGAGTYTWVTLVNHCKRGGVEQLVASVGNDRVDKEARKNIAILCAHVARRDIEVAHRLHEMHAFEILHSFAATS